MPNLSSYGLRYSEPQPKSSGLQAQPRQLNADTQAELVAEILAELSLEQRDLLRQASSDVDLRNGAYEIEQWIHNTWFKPLPR